MSVLAMQEWHNPAGQTWTPGAMWPAFARSTPEPVEPVEPVDADTATALLVAQAQQGDGAAIERLLEQFRPLLRSRMHRVWSGVQEGLAPVEWADVESQVQLFFLTRLQSFEASRGVYFAFYIARLLDLDCQAWVRGQKRAPAVPFSQLAAFDAGDADADLEGWMLRPSATGSDCNEDDAARVDQMLGLQTALKSLSDAQREVVWECCVRGRTETDVAQQLGISRSAVRNRLAAALSRLREYFREQDETAGSCSGVPHIATRTGRASSRRETVPKTNQTDDGVDVPMRVLRRDFWEFWVERMTMAKDEKRPDLVGVGAGQPILLQGTFEFPATGLKKPQLLSPKLSFTVPAGHVLGIRYLRAGVSCPKMVCLSTVVNGLTHRLVPIAAESAMHVNFAIVEPLVAGSQLEIHVASEAPGTAILDVGCLQMPA